MFFLGLYLLFCVANPFFHVSNSLAAGFSEKSPLHHHASTNPSTPFAVVKRFGAVYGAKIFIGYKGDRNILAISTASDFNWILCEPCNPCYNTTESIFNPRNSQTYVKLSCRDNPYCPSLPENNCDRKKNCQFTFRYPQSLSTPDGAYVRGILSKDKLRIFKTRGKIELGDFTFGCTHETNMGNISQDVSGIMGLGRGPLSLVSQMKHEIFSFCFPMRFGNAGWLNFRPAANDPDDGAVTIPFVDDNSNLYKVIIDSISIIGAEDEPIIFMTKPHGVDQAVKQGSEFVIDTGTPLSYIEDYWMQILLEVVKWNTPFPTIFHSQYDICFNISTNPPSKPPLPLPGMKLEFAGDAMVNLNPSNLFVRADPFVTCLTFVTIRRIGREDGFILGSDALKGRKIVIDRKKNEFTIGPLLENC